MSLPHIHPSLTCYKSHHCRCGECVHLAKIDRRNRKFRVKVHKHPSLTCYRYHGCRCIECSALDANAKHKRGEIPNVLPQSEVDRLRRLVGYHEGIK